MSHYETLVALMSLITGMLVTLIGTIWKARGWVDGLRETDKSLAEAIRHLTETMQIQHKENQRRLEALEHRGRW